MSRTILKLMPLCNHSTQPLMVAFMVSLMVAFMVALNGRYAACRIAPEWNLKIIRSRYGKGILNQQKAS